MAQNDLYASGEEISDDPDPVNEYRQSLTELVYNSRPHIVMLTMLADELKESRSTEVAECIEQRLYQVSNESKLPTLYLIDSICKNITNSAYIELFEKKLVKLFCHTFERADERNRLLLHKLRTTWDVHFSTSILRELDVQVNEIDPKWPILSKKNADKVEVFNSNSSRNGAQSNSSQNKPTEIETMDKTNSGTAKPTIIHVQPNDTLFKRNKIELELRKELAKKITPQEQRKNLIDSGVSQNLNSMNKFEPNSHKKAKKIDSISEKSKNKKKDFNNQNNITNPNSKTSPIEAEKSMSMLSGSKKIKTRIPKRKASSPIPQSNKISKKSVLDEVLPVAPDDVIPLGRNHHVSVTKRNKDTKVVYRGSNSVVSSIKNRRFSSSRRHNSPTSHKLPTHQQSIAHQMYPINHSSLSIDPNNSDPISTTIPAPNVFTQPEVLFGSTRSIVNKPTTFVMDRDYRRELINESQPNVRVDNMCHDVMVHESEPRVFPNSLGLPSFNPTSSVEQPSLISFGSPSIPGLLEPYGSTEIFINNEMACLYYLDHITAIVLSKLKVKYPFDVLAFTDPASLEPKQVYFSSSIPTTVFIDPGTPSEQNLTLQFNERNPVTFYLPNVNIPQRIMLGLPARELVINDVPYQTNFGGKPISVFMEADRQWHIFQLSDSRPFLKFSDEIRFDLWQILVNDAISKFKNGGLVPSFCHEQPQPINPAYRFPHSASSTSNMFIETIPLQQSNPLANSLVTSVSSNDSINASAPLASTNENPVTDLNALLSQLTKVGLITNTNQNSDQVEPNNLVDVSSGKSKNKIESKKKVSQPKKYLQLEMAALRKNHRFVVDQLYSGTQCTNCSIRFSDDAFKNDKNENMKSKYARHLDWHFRQNRREKSKPGLINSSMSSVPHRRPWFYNIDQWILYKEVNDDLEEDAADFFDMNDENGNSTGSLQLFFNFDFSSLKNFICDFDSFIQVISSDLNLDDNKKKTLCNVVSESEVTVECSLCYEQFDLKWFEDDEEWRLINAVTYSPTPDSLQYFHPFCLKDHILLQNNKGDQLQEKEINSQNRTYENHGQCIIPGLDALKETVVEEIKAEADSESKEIQIKDEADDVDEKHLDIDQLMIENNDPINLEEQFEVKVEEFEIPIVETLKINDVPSSSSESSEKQTLNTDKQNLMTTTSAQSSIQTSDSLKRGGIVIKMNKSKISTNFAEQGNVSKSSSFNENNVLENESKNIKSESNDIDITVLNSHLNAASNFSNNDQKRSIIDDDDNILSNNKGNDDDIDIDNNNHDCSVQANDIVDSFDFTEIDSSKNQASKKGVDDSVMFNDDDVEQPEEVSVTTNRHYSVIKDNDNVDILHQTIDIDAQSETLFQSLVKNDGGDQSKEAETSEQFCDQDQEINEELSMTHEEVPSSSCKYYSRGHETSSLCSIM